MLVWIKPTSLLINYFGRFSWVKLNFEQKVKFKQPKFCSYQEHALSTTCEFSANSYRKESNFRHFLDKTERDVAGSFCLFFGLIGKAGPSLQSFSIKRAKSYRKSSICPFSGKCGKGLWQNFFCLLFLVFFKVGDCMYLIIHLGDNLKSITIRKLKILQYFLEKAEWRSEAFCSSQPLSAAFR